MAKARILLADDSPTILKVVGSILEQEGYEVITARDGVEAAEKAFQIQPDLILLDVMMPRMNGYQVCRLLKNELQTRHIPILILTSRDQPREKFWGLQTGADEFISKGIENEELLRLVKVFLERGSSVRPLRNAKVQPLQNVDVLTRANELLDRTLYEATVINEIGKLVHSLQDYEETVRSALLILHKLIDYSVAVLAITHGEEGEFIVQTWCPEITEEDVLALKEHVLGILRPYLDPTMIPAQFTTRLLSSEGCSRRKGEHPLPLDQLLYVPVKGKGMVVGIFAVLPQPGHSFDQGDVDTLNLVVTHAYAVIENAWLYEEVRKLSMKDGLTRVFNRRYLDERLEEEFKKSMRYNRPLCILMMDLDHFKRINDRYGHPVGDLTLKKVMECTRETLRSTDVVGRYGGEEFLIILPDTDSRGGTLVAERIRQRIEQCEVRLDDAEQIKVTVSIGVCAIPRPEINTPAQFVAAVDVALYEAKRLGRNRVQLYTPEISVEAEREVAAHTLQEDRPDQKAQPTGTGGDGDC